MKNHLTLPRASHILIAAAIAFVLVTSLVAATRVFAGSSAGESVEFANQLYETGQLTQASQAYEQLANQGINHPNLFYNLANTYFLQGDVGRAVLNYRRAEQMAPRDPDIQANLSLARLQVVDTYNSPESDKAGSPIDAFAQGLGRRTTLDESALIALGGWFALGILFMLWQFARSKRALQKPAAALHWLVILMAIVVPLSGFGLTSRLYVEHTRPDAVVLAGEVQVYGAPGGQETVEFRLHSGAEINLLDQQGDWVQLGLPGQASQGWVPATAVETIARQ